MTPHVDADAKAPLVNAESHKRCHKQRQARLQCQFLHQRRVGLSARCESSIHGLQDEQVESLALLHGAVLLSAGTTYLPKFGSATNRSREANEEVHQPDDLQMPDQPPRRVLMTAAPLE